MGFKRLCCLSLLCAFLGIPAAGGAASWPEQAVNLVVAFAPGGNSDYNARALAKYLGKSLEQPVVVTNEIGRAHV